MYRPLTAGWLSNFVEIGQPPQISIGYTAKVFQVNQYNQEPEHQKPNIANAINVALIGHVG